jgi:hypothetical protein
MQLFCLFMDMVVGGNDMNCAEFETGSPVLKLASCSDIGMRSSHTFNACKHLHIIK